MLKRFLYVAPCLQNLFCFLGKQMSGKCFPDILDCLFRRMQHVVGIKPVIDEGYITNVAVYPAYRRQGAGTALLKRVFEFAVEEKLRFVSLEVRVSNSAAVSLYEKLGFTTEGRRKDFYRNPREDALIMTKRFDYPDEDSEH